MLSCALLLDFFLLRKDPWEFLMWANSAEDTKAWCYLEMTCQKTNSLIFNQYISIEAHKHYNSNNLWEIKLVLHLIYLG